MIRVAIFEGAWAIGLLATRSEGDFGKTAVWLMLISELAMAND